MQQETKPDRYVSFVGIEGDKNSRELMRMSRGHIDDPQKTNRFWELFTEKLDRVGKDLQQPGRADAVWAVAVLEQRQQPPLDLLQGLVDQFVERHRFWGGFRRSWGRATAIGLFCH